VRQAPARKKKSGRNNRGQIIFYGLMALMLVVGAFAGFVLGSIVGVALIVAGREGRKSALPFGPFLIAGAGTAFAFIPVSIAALAGVAEREAGLASGLLNTSQQLGGAIGVAIASTVTAAHVKVLTHQGETATAALRGGLQWALWVCGATALLAIPVTFFLVRSDELAKAVEAASSSEPALDAA